MTCDDVRVQLTGYLDGELDATRGSAVRGHLRGCAACRAIASDEAALRDGMRALPPVDPPASLWAGVQSRLAAAEVADAERPAWRRSLAGWVRALSAQAPRLGLAGSALAAAAVLVVWHSHQTTDEVLTPPPVESRPMVAPRHVEPPAPPPVTAQDRDVSSDLADAPARQTAGYAEAADELQKLADDARARWTDERKQTFDGKVAELRKKIVAAAEGHPRQAAYRVLIRYLQNAAIRDQIAANDHVFAGGCP